MEHPSRGGAHIVVVAETINHIDPIESIHRWGGRSRFVRRSRVARAVVGRSRVGARPRRTGRRRRRDGIAFGTTDDDDDGRRTTGGRRVTGGRRTTTDGA